MTATFGPNVALQPPGWPDTGTAVPALSRRGYRPPSLGYRAPTLEPVGTQSPSPPCESNKRQNGVTWAVSSSTATTQLHLCHHVVSDSTSTSSCHPGSPNPCCALPCQTMKSVALWEIFYFCYSTLCPILQQLLKLAAILFLQFTPH